MKKSKVKYSGVEYTRIVDLEYTVDVYRIEQSRIDKSRLE